MTCLIPASASAVSSSLLGWPPVKIDCSGFARFFMASWFMAVVSSVAGSFTAEHAARKKRTEERARVVKIFSAVKTYFLIV